MSSIHNFRKSHALSIEIPAKERVELSENEKLRVKLDKFHVDITLIKQRIEKASPIEKKDQMTSQIEKIHEFCKRKMDKLAQKIGNANESDLDLVKQIKQIEDEADALVREGYIKDDHPKALSSDEILALNRRKEDPSKVKSRLQTEFELAQTHLDDVQKAFKGQWKKADPEECEIDVFSYHNPQHTLGIASTQGEDHETREDTDVSTSFEITINGKKQNVALYGVFDGHGGRGCSSFLAGPGYLHNYLKKNLNKALAGAEPGTEEAVIYNFLKIAFVNLGEEYRQYQSKHPDMLGGSTANITLIIGDDIWNANLGDSRCIVSTKDKAVALSKDAKPLKDKRSISKRGGRILLPSTKENVPRVIGQTREALAMSRAVGHSEAHSGINPRSKITKYRLSDMPKGQNFLVIATYGLWDVASSNDVAKFIQENSSKKPEEIAALLVKKANEAGSTDDITVMIVALP